MTIAVVRAEESMPSTFHAADGRYRFSVLDGMIEFIVDHVRRERQHQLIAEIQVRCFLKSARVYGENSALLITTLNCTNARARQDLSRLLANGARTGNSVDWLGYLEDFTQRIWLDEREGSPMVPLHEIPRPTEDAALDVFGLRVLRQHPQIVFSPGGTGKSLLGLAIAGELGRHGIRTGFFDWETEGGEQRVRGDALGLPHTVWYRRCDQPLVVLADSIRREVADRQLEFLLIDSIAPGCDGKVEDSETAIAFFKAWRRIGCGGLAIAHTRSEDGEQRPFGSVFWHNLARSTWFLKRVNEQSTPNTLTLGVFHRKANFGPLRPPFGLEMALQNADGAAGGLTGVIVRRTDIAEVSELATSLPLWQRIKHSLRTGPRTIVEIAEDLDAKADTVKKALARDKGRAFTLIPKTDDGIQRWALMERRSA